MITNIKSMVFRKKRFAFLFFLGFVFSKSHAQDSTNTVGRVSISSPNAASLGKYGDVPVSYHTGIPDIGIPIYTIKSRSLSLPISLSYHASGLKVEENASWVGAGWSLNAGGMITRTVRGAPDDRGYNNGYNMKGFYSDSGWQNYLLYSFPSYRQVSQGPDDAQFQLGRNDGEPDLFTFNFNGHSGKFYFNDDQSPILIPEEDLKIQTDFTLGPGFNGFIITSSDGVKYFFGKTGNNGVVDPIEITYSNTTQSSYGLENRATSSWFLNKIVSADGMDSILLNYQAEKYSSYSLAMFPRIYGGSNMSQPQGAGILFSGYSYEYDLVKQFVQGVRLSSISFSNGTVNFIPQANPRVDLAGFDDQSWNDQADTSAKALSSIQISTTGNFCQSYNLFYSYFHDSNPLTGGLFSAMPILSSIQSDSYRLRLDSIQEVSCDNNIKIPPYKFGYFSETVPRKLSFGMDHWGFYNGVNNNTSLLPASTMVTDQTFYKINGANRDPAWPAMRGGTLSRITYPTSGYTDFDFEANTTYTSYYDYTLTSQLNRSAGYSGTNGTDAIDSFYYSFNGDFYQLTLNANTNGGSSYMSIYPSGNPNPIQSISANVGQSSTITFKVPQGLYLIRLVKQSPASGYGAYYNLSEYISTYQNKNSMVGGLRIKTITNHDAITNQSNVTSYSYNISNDPNGHSSGILYSRPTYIQILRNDVMALIWGGAGYPHGCANPENTGSLMNYFRSPSSVRPMGVTQGNHIGYNEVYVSKTGNGYSVYRYYGSNAWDNIVSDVCVRSIYNTQTCDPTIPNYPEAPPAFEPLRGELKYEGYFNQGGQLVRDVYYYPQFTQSKIPTQGHIDFDSQAWRSYTDYTLYSYRKVQDKTISTDYSSAGSLTQTKTIYYGSPFHHAPTRTVMMTSTGDSLVTNMQYAFDYRINNCDAIPDSLPNYLNQIHADSASYFNYIGSCSPQTGDYSNCRYTQLPFLRYNLSQDRIQYMNYLKRQYSNVNSTYNNFHLTAKASAETELKPILELQDAFENLVIERSNWKDNNLLHSDFTRYDYVSSPTGKVFPNKTQLINLASPSATFTNSSVSGNTIMKDGRYTDENYFKFNDGNPQQVTAHNGIVVSYVWDYLNSEPIAKVTGAGSDQVAYTSFEGDGTGSWSVGSTIRNFNSGITGSQSYNLLNGSCNKIGLNSASSYIISYWSNSGSYSVSNTTSIIQGRSVNGWTYYEHLVTNPGNGIITVSGTGSIDELRLYPKAAQMDTYTYFPNIGLSSECDVNNRINYYFYDGLGRLKYIKDQEGNIVKTIDYHYMGQ